MINPTFIPVLAVASTLALGMFAGSAEAQHAGHTAPPPKEQSKPKEQQAKPQPQKPADHTAHMAEKEKASQQPKEPIPPLTDADRAAAFPPNMGGHAVHDRAINYMLLFDQVEWRGADGGGANWENTSWVGGDLNRLWVRTEGESENGRVDNFYVDALWGRPFSRWWDFVAGVRQDFRPGDPQTWVGAGVQGLAPYWFEIEATGYVGAGGRTHARLEAEYELLMTNRLILQPLVELEIFGKSDPERGIGAGLSTVEAGLRLRYEFRREFAPYVGLTWDRKLFGTADFARAEGEDISGARLALGLRFWF